MSALPAPTSPLSEPAPGSTQDPASLPRLAGYPSPAMDAVLAYEHSELESLSSSAVPSASKPRARWLGGWPSIQAALAHRVISHVLAPDPEDDAPTPAVPQPGDHHA